MNKYLFVFIMVIIGCTDEKDFIKKHGSKDFSNFKNYGFLVRSKDSNGGTVIFGSDLRNSFKVGPLIFEFNKKGELESTSYKLVADSMALDRIKMESLAMQFFQYDIALLRVDSIGNVFVGINNNEYPTLAQIKDLKAPGLDKYKFSLIKDAWYLIEKK